MRHVDPRGSLLACGLVATLVTVGCGDDDRTPSGGTLTTISVGAGTTTGAGGTGGMAGMGGAGASIPNTPCEAPAEALEEVYPDGTERGLTRLVPIGNRWIASGSSGYVRFDRDGTNADTTPTTIGGTGFNVLAGEPSAVGYASAGSNYVGYQRLGENDVVTGPRSLSMDTPNGIALGAAGDDSVTVWAFNGALRGRTVEASGNLANDDFLVRAGAYATSIAMHGVSGSSNLHLFWSGSADQGIFQSQMLRVGPTGPDANDPNVFYTTPVQHDLIRVVPIDDGYMVLVLDAMADARFLRLDENGNLMDQSPVLEGVTLAYDLATQGDRVAVVAGRESGEPELRVFDLDFAPAGPWICLGDDHDASVAPAIAADGNGYAAIFQTEGGATMLGRVDAVGTGAP